MAERTTKAARVVSVAAATVIALACGTNVIISHSCFKKLTDTTISMPTQHGRPNLRTS